MNWSGGNDAFGMRFENRVLPNYAGYGHDTNWVNSPLYGTTSGVNQYILPMVTTGARQTPSTMQHGEIVICRIGNNPVSGPPSSGPTPAIVHSITQGATPQVVTTAAHGFTTGQKIYHMIPAGKGMAKLDRFPATITVVNSTTYNITNFNSTSERPMWPMPARLKRICRWTSARAASIRSRSAPAEREPVTTATTVLERISGRTISKTFYFDKTTMGGSDGAGNYVMGAWIFTDGGNNKGHWDGVPLEILTKLIVELNAMRPHRPISMWICYPHRSLMSEIDPDYLTASSWPIHATNIILNCNTVGGVTYPGLETGATGATLYIEYANEIWNPTPQNYWHQWYLRGHDGERRFRLPDAHALGATAMARDIRAAFPTETKIKN